MLRRITVFPLVLLLALALTAQNDKPTPDKKGHFLDENTYSNPALAWIIHDSCSQKIKDALKG